MPLLLVSVRYTIEEEKIHDIETAAHSHLSTCTNKCHLPFKNSSVYNDFFCSLEKTIRVIFTGAIGVFTLEFSSLMSNVM